MGRSGQEGRTDKTSYRWGPGGGAREESGLT